MIIINSIKKGIVIDHIKSGLGIKLFHYLKLYDKDFTVALIMNAESNKIGKKDMIKIQDEIDIDYTILGLIDPNITVNIIEDEVIVKKVNLNLPERVENVLACKNPRCVTSIEKYVPQIFNLIDTEKGLYSCEYCEEIVKSTALEV